MFTLAFRIQPNPVGCWELFRSWFLEAISLLEWRPTSFEAFLSIW